MGTVVDSISVAFVNLDFCREEMAGWTGLEPAASGVTGRRSNQLNYHPKMALRTTNYELLTRVGGAGLEPATPGV